MKSVFTLTRASHWRTALAVNSDPLSLRMCSGTPRSTNSRPSRYSTSSDTRRRSTSIEMWEAHEHGQTVVTISPLKHNWAVKFLSHVLYGDIEEFERAVTSGQL